MRIDLADHQVIQRDVAWPVRGAAAAGSRVTLSIAGRTFDATADAAGRFCITLEPMPAGGPYDVVVQAGDEEQTAKDVLIGDVWLAAGQSNMAMTLRMSDAGEAVAAATDINKLRLHTAPYVVGEQADCDASPPQVWQACRHESAADFSAVGFYFGRALSQAIDVPVGLIAAAIGATPGEAWTPMSVLEANPAFTPILERWRRSQQRDRDAIDAASDVTIVAAEYAVAFAAWDGKADAAERAGRPIPGAHPKHIPAGHPWTPAGLFDGMIKPLTAKPIRGVIWYQGEGAPERAFQYRSLFRALIRHWRDAWRQPRLPFYFVQAPRFGPRRDQPAEHSWAELREAQAMALNEPATGMAVTIDLGDEKDIHPGEKQPIGERLANLALSKTYGRDVACEAPRLAGVTIDGSRVRLRFDHVGGGLKTIDGLPPRGFAVSAGGCDFGSGNRKFTWADATLHGDEVVLQSAAVPRPVAARYAWAQNPDANVVNEVGLPMAPWRTDDWPGVTVLNR